MAVKGHVHDITFMRLGDKVMIQSEQNGIAISSMKSFIREEADYIMENMEERREIWDLTEMSPE